PNQDTLPPNQTVPANQTAVVPVLKKGDYLLFEEVLGPVTGLPADASPSHRQVVQIDEDPEVDQDPLFSNNIANGKLQPWQPLQTPLPLLRVHWRIQDAPTFPLCLSTRPVNLPLLRNVTVARGNIVLADHGITTGETVTLPAPIGDPTNFRLPLSQSPLTMQIEPQQVKYDPATLTLLTQRTDLTGSAPNAKPAVALSITFPADTELWVPVDDLLESSSFDQNFVVEVSNRGQGILRFGDEEYGRSVFGATAFRGVY